MRKLEDLSLAELIVVAEDEGLTEAQRGKVKIYAMGRIKETLATEQSEQTKETLNQILDEYRFSIGTDDMGYPYRPEELGEKTQNVQRVNPTDVKAHVDMYQGEM